MVRCGAAGCSRQQERQRSMAIYTTLACATLLFTYSSMKVMKQGTSFSVFVFLWLRSMWMDRTQRQEKAKTVEDKRATGGQGCGELVPHAIVGQDSWVGQLGTTAATLCCFGNFMKKEGRSGTAGGGIAGEYCSPGPWRRGSWVTEDAGWWTGGEGDGEMMEGGGREQERWLWTRPSWVVAKYVMIASSSFFSISFPRLVKNFTKRNFIFPSHPTPAFARHGAAGPPTPPVAVVILMFL